MTVRTAVLWMSRLVTAGLLFAGAAHADVAYKVDHTDVALFESIPDSYLSQIRQMTIQFTGQSHGRQVPHGLELLAATDSKYAVQIAKDLSDLGDTNALKVERSYYQFELSRWFNYDSVDDDDYWSTSYGRAWTEASASQAKAAGQPFTVSIWCWCWDMSAQNWVHNENGDLMTFNDERMNAYLSAISSFNGNSSLDPTVFVYHTSVTDAGVNEGGWKTTYYNDQIRQTAAANNGVLFDQADIENWNEAGTNQRVETWNGNTLYLRHADYDEDVGVPFTEGHTNDALCIRKAKALWVLLARMSGWDGGSTSVPELSLTSPNGGESLTAGTQHSITWTSADISAINIQFSSNSGSSWTTVASGVSAATGSYSWTVPSVASTQCRIRLTESSSGSVTDTSAAAFSIVVAGDPELFLVSPNGGENLTAGNLHYIRWYAADIAAIDIQFSSDNGSSWTTVASDMSVTGGTYAWTVPAVASSQCRIRLTESASGRVTDTSTGTFTITVTSGAVWGDVDDSNSVTVVDALQIATYDIDPLRDNLAPFLEAILERGDVNADNRINSTDALICASYEINPDNPNNPPRVGNVIGTVSKIAVETVGEALPDLLVMSDGNDQVSVLPSVSPSPDNIMLGALSIRITWDPQAFSFVALDNSGGSTVSVNSENSSTGEVMLAWFDTNGAETFTFPLLSFERIDADENDAFTMEIWSAAAADTFNPLSTEHGYVSQVVGVDDETPAVFTLEQNSPNPFNPETTIRFTIERAGEVVLAVYNIQGQLVSQLVDSYLTPGQHEVRWDGRSDHAGPAASGIYIYQLRMEGRIDQKPMVLLR